VLLVYDITRKSSFDHLASWLDDLHMHGGKDMVITLVGNKWFFKRKRKERRRMDDCLKAVCFLLPCLVVSPHLSASSHHLLFPFPWFHLSCLSSDLEDMRQVPKAMGQQFADSHGLGFVEASAKSAACVDEVP
jgi:GTPase SAR1 family protein